MSATVLSPRQFGEDTPHQEPPAAWARQALLATPPTEDEYVHPAAIGMALGGFGLFRRHPGLAGHSATWPCCSQSSASSASCTSCQWFNAASAARHSRRSKHNRSFMQS
jgi:hypothetical protein